MDERTQAGTEGLEYAAERGLAVVIMEPLRGGVLAQPLPANLEAERKRLGIQWSPAQLGLRWVLDHPEVTVALSGMNQMGHVDQNVAVAAATEPGSMTEGERALVAAVRDRYREKMAVDCTACRYCMPCPQGVNIPRTFQLLNEVTMFNPMPARVLYQQLTSPDEWASNCVECGACEEHCPQRISIVEKLAEAHKALTEKVDSPLTPA
jgi:predicted aldo/keto reductase-like oxidoreductase